jgi:phosphoglycerate dehydrogenase-like enzyme
MPSTRPDVLLSVPDQELLDALQPLPAGVGGIVWDLTDEPRRSRIDLVVTPYMGDAVQRLPAVAAVRPRLVQSQMLGYDGVAERLPAGTVFANAVGVHESSTAELALALILASLRGLPAFARQAASGVWPVAFTGTSLADRRVLVLGTGGVGRAVAERLRPFEVELVRVARTARTDEDGRVHGVDELPELLPEADVVVLAIPLGPSTRGLVDHDFLNRMRDGALLVNVSRGPVVDTEALASAVRFGGMRAALDVTDPEPLPAGHPLLASRHVLISPHVGGNSTAMRPRIARLVRTQAERLRDGLEPLHVVLRT